MSTTTKTLARWVITFLAFPLGGLLAELVGPVDDPLSAAAGALVAGAVIGAAQWWALRPVGVSWRWVPATAVAMSAANAVAAALTDSSTSTGSLALTGLVVGATVGAAQGLVLGRGRPVAAAWSATVAVAWAVGWTVTAGIGVDVESGYAVFGSSGALVATVLSGLVLVRLVPFSRNETAGHGPAASGARA